MKNELGIEVKCEYCLSGVNANTCCWYPEKDSSKIVSTNLCHFKPYSKVFIARIKELQKVMREEADAIDLGVSALKKHYEGKIQRLEEQQFTKEELQFIKDRLDECIEEWDVPDMVFMAHQILKKIEQSLKNLEGNLNNEQ